MNYQYTLSALCAFCILATCLAQQKSFSSYNHFLKPPADNIQSGGRLTDRQIGYISQAGYKSLLSVVQFSTNDTVFNGVNGSFPSSDYEMSIAASYGLAAKYVVSSLTAESAYEISVLMKEMPKPIFVHCHVSLSTRNSSRRIHDINL